MKKVNVSLYNNLPLGVQVKRVGNNYRIYLPKNSFIKNNLLMMYIEYTKGDDWFLNKFTSSILDHKFITQPCDIYARYALKLKSYSGFPVFAIFSVGILGVKDIRWEINKTRTK